jgi:hypothetical protein
MLRSPGSSKLLWAGSFARRGVHLDATAAMAQPQSPLCNSPAGPTSRWRTMTRETIIRIYTTFRSKESAFLRRHTDQLSEDQSQHFDLLIFLLGLKPAVLVCPNYTTPALTAEAIAHVWQPTVADVCGAELSEIKHSLVTWHGSQNWQGMWVLFDASHEAYPFVAHALLTPRSGDVPISETGAALGYPASKCNDPSAFTGEIDYMCDGELGLEFLTDYRQDVDMYLAHFFAVRQGCAGIVDVQLRLGGWQVPLEVLSALRTTTAPRARLGIVAVAYFINAKKQYRAAPYRLGCCIELIVDADFPDALAQRTMAMPEAFLQRTVCWIAETAEAIQTGAAQKTTALASLAAAVVGDMRGYAVDGE